MEMNRNRLTVRGAAHRLSMAVAMMAMVLSVMLTGCSGNSSGDARDLLATVPSDATFVGVVDIKGLLKATGSKTDGGSITAGPMLQDAIGSISDEKRRAEIDAVMQGESGVSMTAAVLVITSRQYMLLMVDDPEKARKFFAARDEELTENDGIASNRYAALSGNKLWISLDNSISTDEIRGFVELSEKQSYASSAGADRLVAMEHTFSGLGDLSGISRNSMVSRQLPGFSLVLSTLFASPEYLGVTADVTEDTAKASVSVLDEKFKPARYLLPAGSVSKSVVSSLGGTAETVVAFDIPSKLVRKLIDLASSLGGGLPVDVSGLLEPIDGTLAVAMNQDAGNMRGVVTTTGERTSALFDMLGSFGTVTREGKSLRVISGGEVKGALQLSEAAKLLDGTVGGLVIEDSEAMKRDGIRRTVITLTNADNGLQLNVDVTFDPEALAAKARK